MTVTGHNLLLKAVKIFARHLFFPSFNSHANMTILMSQPKKKMYLFHFFYYFFLTSQKKNITTTYIIVCPKLMNHKHNSDLWFQNKLFSWLYEFWIRRESIVFFFFYGGYCHQWQSNIEILCWTHLHLTTLNGNSFLLKK